MAAAAALFDVDGTLVDSVDLHAEAWQRAFRRFGKEVAFGDVRSQIGKGGDQLLPVFFSKRELAEFGHEMEEYRHLLYVRELMPRVRPFPGVRDLFEGLRHRGVRIALATSAKEDELDYLRDLLGVGDLLHAATSSDDADRSKPHPDIFAAALERTGARVEEAVVIGDSPYDAIAARRLGARCVGLRCGGFPEEALLHAGCMVVREDPRDLLAHVDDPPFDRRYVGDAEAAAP